MTSPIEEITINCPECGYGYKDWHRASVNLNLDDFDDEYLDECSSAMCPKCRHKVYFDSLTVKDGTMFFDELDSSESGNK